MAPRELAQNLAVAALSLLLLLAVLELAVRLTPGAGHQHFISVLDVDWDRPTRFLPGSRRTYQSDEFTFTVSNNSHGRRDSEWSTKTIADPRSILVIGDSFVLGSSVEASETIPERMEARLAEAGDPREVFNFGMGGIGPLQYATILEDALREGFAARTIVVALFVGNDFYPSVLQPPEPARAAAEPNQDPPAGGSALLRFLRVRASQSPRLVGVALTAGRWLGIPVYDPAGIYIFLRQQTQAQRDLFEGILSHVTRMRQLASAHGRRLYVVVIPNKIQVENGVELTGPFYDAAAPNQRILSWCEREGIPCLDLLPALSEAARDPAPLYFRVDRHFTPRGYALAADLILAFLSEQGARRP